MSPGSRAGSEPGGRRQHSQEAGQGRRGVVVWCGVVWCGGGVITILQILSSNCGPGQVKTSQECGEVERAPAQSPPVPLNRQWSSQLPFPPELSNGSGAPDRAGALTEDY